MPCNYRFRAIILLAIVATASSVTGQIKPAGDAPPLLSPEQSAARFKVSPGFRIELVASEPLLADPTCIAFDEHGRMLACELHGYNLEGYLDIVELNKTGQLDKQVRRIRASGEIMEEAKRHQIGKLKLLTDTDGDGRMDKADVWADDLPTCYGIIPARGGVIVVCAPDIVYLADRDGDGKAEVREKLFTGFRIEMLERGINNPRWGLDNWIYVGSGGGGGTITGPHLDQPVAIGNTDFRFKPDGSAIEPVTGNVGTFGMALNEIGDRFPASGGQPAIYSLPLDYRYLRRNPHVSSPRAVHSAADYNKGYPASKPHPWRAKRAQDPAWVKFYGKHETTTGYFTGGCGDEFYLATRFPESHRGQYYYCEPSLNIIHRSIVERNGSGYRARRAPGEEKSEFLASTHQWFRPVNLRVGPDGALYIVDMCREIIEDYSAIPRFLQQQYNLMNGSDRGRIWRIVPEGVPPRKPVDLGSLSSPQLVKFTGDADFWWRQTAQRLIVERGDRSVAPLLAAQVRSGSTPAARLHALRTLQGLAALQPADVLHALDDADYAVRMHALQLCERWLASDDKLITKVTAMTDDPDPRVRLQLAMTLGETSDRRGVEALVGLALQHADDRWMPSAILSSANESAGALLARLLKTPDLTAGANSMFSPLTATISGRRDTAQIEQILGALADRDASIQTLCLDGLIDGLSRGERPDALSSAGAAGLKKLLASDSPDVRPRAVRLGALLGLASAPEMKAAFAQASATALDAGRAVAQRQQAIELLAYAPFAALAPTVGKLLDVQQPPELQVAAIKTLSASDDSEVVATLLKDWSSRTPRMRAAVLDAIFARQDRLLALLDAIEAKKISPQDLNANRREQLLKYPNDAIAKRAGQLIAAVEENTELQERYQRYLKALDGPRNAQRGKEVYTKHCLNCHRIKETGFEVGPDLASALNRPDDAILLDILDPSRHIESEYRSYTVVTKKGLIFTGVLASDTATNIALRKDKGVVDSILRKDIETISASNQSLMPSNVHEQVTPQDAADLLAYIRLALASPKK